MARFFPYNEISGRDPTPVEDLHWLGGQLERLPAFVEGTAVLCGSVAWGNHSWRSDIDVAHFQTKKFSNLSPSIEDVVAKYRERTGDRFISPKVHVTTIGAESVRLIETKGSSYGAIFSTIEKKTEHTFFAGTALRFADHIGRLAEAKGDPWQTFYQRYLAAIKRDQGQRREELKSYVSSVTKTWEQQPLHRLNLDPEGHLTQEQLDAIAQAANYPIHLMRRILGLLNRYPSPDRVSDIRAGFSEIPDRWAKDLRAFFEPFFRMDGRYTEIAAACRLTEKPLSAAEYSEQVCSLAIDLPFGPIQEQIWSYLKKGSGRSWRFWAR
jgi:hypothetical protein